MSPLSTEDFPYTIGYVTKLLNVDEADLMSVVRALELKPRRDDRSGELVFTYTETEMLRKAIELSNRGEEMTTIARYFGVGKAQKPSSEPISAPLESPAVQMAPPVAASGTYGTAIAQAVKTAPIKVGKESLAVVVEAVSNAKEGILKDMSRMLDDKLAGLDEVVVELIRCKSENDTLKQKLKDLSEEKTTLQHELTRFKPTGFGFFRKN